MGEVASAIPLIRDIRRRKPQSSIYLSTGTLGGRKIAESQTSGLIEGIFYAPIDFVFAVRRVLRTIRPSLLIVLETEIWPNLFSQAKLAGCAVVLVNGRISDRTWPRYQRFRALFRPIVSITHRVYVQSGLDRERFRSLGVPEAKLALEANLKYDAAAHPVPLDLETFGASKIWIAASTVGPDETGSLERHNICEEEEIIGVFRQMASFRKSLLLILAPRQPSRFKSVAALVAKSGFPFLQRSEMARMARPALELPGILLLDTMGELARIYQLADVVFVGGSLAPRGGHNIIEPAFAGVPVVVGPHMQNFAAICRDFLEAGAIEQVSGTTELASTIERLLDNPDEAKRLGARGQAVARAGVGAAGRLGQQLMRLQSIYHFRRPRVWAVRTFVTSLALLWTWGGNVKRRRAEKLAARRPAVGAPVISIGGITVGGSGKTPFANYLATGLRRRGFHPAILTRGYRRRSSARHLVVSAGTGMPTSFTGDEAQIYLRTGDATVGIGADRYETGIVLLRHYPETDVLLLDDGFQHARLARDLDIVIIDGLDPFGQDGVVPLGRLREPLSALARADVFVVTRCQSPEHLAALQTRLGELNPKAPVFESRLRPVRWRSVKTGEQVRISAGARVAAFCGLGNPKNFFATLEAMDLEVVSRTCFGDHHPYQPKELNYLSQVALRHGAEFLVTTEKDRVNFPQHAPEALNEIETAWLEIEVSVTDEEGLFRAIEKVLSPVDAGTARREL